MTRWQRWGRGIMGAIGIMVGGGIFLYFFPLDHIDTGNVIVGGGIAYFLGWCDGARREKKESVPLIMRDSA